MGRTCFRPGCTATILDIGVCVRCANSSYDARMSGIQYRDPEGRFVTTTPGERRMPRTPPAPRAPDTTVVR